MTIDNLIEYHEYLYMYKILNKKMPKSLGKKYYTYNMFHTYRTRIGNNIMIPRRSKQIYKTSIFYKSIELWNTLTEEEKNSKSLAIFKRKIRKKLQ